MLIVLSGLPGVGKTTIARELSQRLGVVHVRIDSIEQAVRASGVTVVSLDDAGYRVGYAVAEDNLRLGHVVVADSVNPLSVTRDAWLTVAERAAVPSVEIEIVCSDLAEHRRRVEHRQVDVPGLDPVSWNMIVSREYEAWDRSHVVINTATSSVADAIAAIVSALPGRARC